MTAKTQDNPRGRTRTLKFGILLALIAVILTMWAVVAGSIISSRQALIQSARHDASGLAGTFGAELAHTFDDITTAANIIASRMREARRISTIGRTISRSSRARPFKSFFSTRMASWSASAATRIRSRPISALARNSVPHRAA